MSGVQQALVYRFAQKRLHFLLRINVQHRRRTNFQAVNKRQILAAAECRRPAADPVRPSRLRS